MEQLRQIGGHGMSPLWRTLLFDEYWFCQHIRILFCFPRFSIIYVQTYLRKLFPWYDKQVMIGWPPSSHTIVSKKKQKQWTEGKLILADGRHFVVTSQASHVTTHWPRVSPFASPSSPEPPSPTCSTSPLCTRTLIDWCGTCLHRNQTTSTCINDDVDTRASGPCPGACFRVSDGVRWFHSEPLSLSIPHRISTKHPEVENTATLCLCLLASSAADATTKASFVLLA